MSRRQWLTMAAGAAAWGMLPFDAFARIATAAAAAETTDCPGLCVLLDAGELSEPLRQGIETIVTTVPDARLSVIDLGTVPKRLDALVAHLEQWRGQVLLGAVLAQRALLLEEALRELGAAWLSHGEHVQVAGGDSRHRWLDATTRAGQTEIWRFTGTQQASAAEWAEALGRGMALRALAPGATAPLLPLTTPGEATACAAPFSSARIVSLVTRI